MAKFPDSIIEKAWQRQDEKCAGCCKKLVRENIEKGQRGAWHAHHRVSEKKGGSNSLANCVIFCINHEGGCHLKIGHGGDWNKHPALDDKKLKCLYKKAHR